MSQEVTLYIRKNISSVNDDSTTPAPVRVELFDDETISLTSTIQNIKDIKKVFTDFSHEFNVPASKTNNKLFEHYYNWNVIRGFDARWKADAFLQLNGFFFRNGKLRLNSVKMKDNKAFSYRLTFFGETILLSDILGEDELHTLPLSDYDHLYNTSLGKSGLEVGLVLSGGAIIEGSGRDLVYPMLTHTTQFEFDGSGFHNVGGSAGIAHSDIKPAIRLDLITAAIETKYGLTFSTDFFNNVIFTQLYMWLHREEGAMTSGNDTELWVFKIIGSTTDWVLDTGSTLIPVVTDWLTEPLNILDVRQLLFTITPVSGTGPYDMRIRNADTGEIIEDGEKQNVSNAQTVTVLLSSEYLKTWNLLFEFETAGNVTSFTPTLIIRERTVKSGVLQQAIISTATYVSDPANQTPLGEVIIAHQMPRMKIIDFLTSIWKMFNLTAFVDSDGTINVLTLDDYYATGKEIDITEYVDVTSQTVDRLLPHNHISFSYAKPKTFLIINKNEITNSDFGNLEYRSEDNFDGDKYEIDVQFEHMLYERMTNSGALTEIMHGWFVDHKTDPTLGSPLIFYSENRTCSTDNIKWVDASELDTYNTAQNTKPNDSHTLNFGAEIDEFDLVTNLNGLFKKEYTQYMEGIFNKKGRLIKLTAFLPLRILLEYELNDTFVVNKKKFRINEITTILQTGKSPMELYTFPVPITIDTEFEDGAEYTFEDLVFYSFN